MDQQTLNKANECVTTINNALNNLDGIEDVLKDGELYRLEFHTKNGRPVRLLGAYSGEAMRYDALDVTPALRKYLEAVKTRLIAELQNAELELEKL